MENKGYKGYRLRDTRSAICSAMEAKGYKGYRLRDTRAAIC